MGLALRDLPLLVRAWITVLYVHRLVRTGGFQPLRQYLSTPSPASRRLSDADRRRFCAIVQHACALSVRRSTCLHRSAVLVRLLRTAGCDARLVFGVQFEPYRGHAWVQAGDAVVNDDPRVLSQYVVVETM